MTTSRSVPPRARAAVTNSSSPSRALFEVRISSARCLGGSVRGKRTSGHRPLGRAMRRTRRKTCSTGDSMLRSWRNAPQGARRTRHKTWCPCRSHARTEGSASAQCRRFLLGLLSARTPCPSRGTSSWLWSGARRPSPGRPFAGTACRGRGGSGRRGGACHGARPAPMPRSSRPRRAPARIGLTGSRSHRAGAGRRPQTQEGLTGTRARDCPGGATRRGGRASGRPGPASSSPKRD